MLAAACARSAKPVEIKRDAVATSGDLSLIQWKRRFLPHYCGDPDNDLHYWTGDICDRARRERGVRANLLGPRGSGKSTIAVTANALRGAVDGSEPLTWIISDTAGQAREQLEQIKDELLENETLRQAYPWACGRGPTWRVNRIVLRNGAAIQAFGRGEKVRGRKKGAARPSLIIGDDIQAESCILSPTRRENDRIWFWGSVVNAGDERTNFMNLATALHRDAIGSILDAAPGWITRRFKAIEEWPANLALWNDWEAILFDKSKGDSDQRARAFYDFNREAMDAGHRVLWPKKTSLYALMAKRAEIGRQAFEREQQSREVNPSECEWGDEYFGEWIWYRGKIENVRGVAIALDPSKGKSDKVGDYSAIAIAWITADGHIYVRTDLARRPVGQMITDLVRWAGKLFPVAVGIESNMWQELLCGEFAAACQRAALVPPVVIPLENMEAKEVRIRRLDPWLSSRRLHFLDGDQGTRLTVQQMQDFPIGDHDDGPDAVEMAIRVLLYLMGGGRQGVGSYIS